LPGIYKCELSLEKKVKNQKIIIHEVGLRDGLQVEKTVVPLQEKLRWIEGLFQARIDIIQLGSFVNPEKVPQMADTDQLFKQLIAAKTKPGTVTLSGLVLNEKGLDRGLAFVSGGKGDQLDVELGAVFFQPLHLKDAGPVVPP